jgi:hypothetical protein
MEVQVGHDDQLIIPHGQPGGLSFEVSLDHEQAQKEQQTPTTWKRRRTCSSINGCWSASPLAISTSHAGFGNCKLLYHRGSFESCTNA